MPAGRGSGASGPSASDRSASSADTRAAPARTMLRSTTTSFGPPTSSRCSVLSRRSRISWRCRSSS
ncbi:hypothetical protein CS379_04610 [Methylobacterium frigidaeris]|nr:hypothetical protein CS379_04610 [Methylobacterium frigidaeris]